MSSGLMPWFRSSISCFVVNLPHPARFIDLIKSPLTPWFFNSMTSSADKSAYPASVSADKRELRGAPSLAAGGRGDGGGGGGACADCEGGVGGGGTAYANSEGAAISSKSATTEAGGAGGAHRTGGTALTLRTAGTGATAGVRGIGGTCGIAGVGGTGASSCANAIQCGPRAAAANTTSASTATERFTRNNEVLGSNRPLPFTSLSMRLASSDLGPPIPVASISWSR